MLWLAEHGTVLYNSCSSKTCTHHLSLDLCMTVVKHGVTALAQILCLSLLQSAQDSWCLWLVTMLPEAAAAGWPWL